MTRYIKSIVYLVLVFNSPIACNVCSDRSRVSIDPARCTITDIGDAMVFIENGNIDSNRMVHTEAIPDQHSLIWKDKKSQEIYYITKLMGTQQKLFFKKRLVSGEKPGFVASFAGHLLRWDELHQTESIPIAKALDSEYGIQIIPDQTYLINADTKPKGCP